MARLEYSFVFCLLVLVGQAFVSESPSSPHGNLDLDRVKAVLSQPQPFEVPLPKYFNNQAFGLRPGEADFDGYNQSYSAQQLYTDGIFTSSTTGVSYLFPGYQGQDIYDNILCQGQTISVPLKHYFSMHLLVASDFANTIVSSNLTLTYADNTTSKVEIRAKPWVSTLTLYKGDIIFPFRYTSNNTNFNSSHIFEYITPVLPEKQLIALTLPITSDISQGRVHVFSMSLRKASGVFPQYIRPTQKSTKDVQIVEVGIGNAGYEWVAGDRLEVRISGPGITTVQPGFVKRLRPGDQRKVSLQVSGNTTVAAHVELKASNLTRKFSFPEMDFGLKPWNSSLDSLTMHESPDWFNDAKFGIFIHWGPYAVPGWGNSTPYEDYAEWYWWYSHSRNDQADTIEYNLRTYGPDHVYDDFFSNFTASKFDPKSWVDLFDAAGAQYFVFTSKHHDGFAMFNTVNTTHRNAIHYGPKRDILQDLFSAAKQYQPHLHRGTYFSLPEWYNPDFGPYGFVQAIGDEGNSSSSIAWPGILAVNPYTNKTEPYTGRLNISDYIVDLQVPQMELLAYNYETEIMWCDCGAANGTANFASAWFNKAREQDREVTMNSRCGITQGSDFDTPEYETFSSISPRKWESNRGMDPFSYGYNRATPESSYMNATTVVTSLVDIVSKNGNFLLDIGPKADGTIDAAEQTNLREAGIWIKANAEAIFNTTYWFLTPGEGNIRFTQTNDAFYILMLEKPVKKFVVDAPVPILEGDRLSMIGAGNGTEVAWSRKDGGIEVDIPAQLAEVGKYCWVLKVDYRV